LDVVLDRETKDREKSSKPLWRQLAAVSGVTKVPVFLPAFLLGSWARFGAISILITGPSVGTDTLFHPAYLNKRSW